MQDYRRLLLVAVLAWITSAVAVQAEDDGSSGVPCNAFCRFWLGRSDRQSEAPPPPAVAAEAPPPVEAAPQPDEPEAQPRIRRKGYGTRKTVSESLPAQRPSAAAVEEGQGTEPNGTAASAPRTAAASRPMDLTPEEAAAADQPVVEAPAAPLPPSRPPVRSRKQQTARSRRPVPPARPTLPDAVAAATAGLDAGKPPASPSEPPLDRASVAAPAAPPRRPAAALLAPKPSAPAPSVLGAAAPAARPAEVSRLEVGTGSPAARPLPGPDARPSVPDAAPVRDTKRLHDVAPGPRPDKPVIQTSSIPRTPKRPTDPEASFEALKATIMRSAQEALKESEVHGF